MPGTVWGSDMSDHHHHPLDRLSCCESHNAGASSPYLMAGICTSILHTYRQSKAPALKHDIKATCHLHHHRTHRTRGMAEREPVERQAGVRNKKVIPWIRVVKHDYDNCLLKTNLRFSSLANVPPLLRMM
eukprot:1147412-Pelagomonas_calceolata.AAC.2